MSDKASQRSRRIQETSGERLAPLGSVNPVDESKPTPVPSVSTQAAKRPVKLEISFTAFGGDRGHHDHLAFTGHFNAHLRILGAELFELFITHALIGRPQPDDQSFSVLWQGEIVSTQAKSSCISSVTSDTKVSIPLVLMAIKQRKRVKRR
ncbi:MAG: hypothetical protein WKF84_09075 [Pyrinomonadaceae bacterium]